MPDRELESACEELDELDRQIATARTNGKRVLLVRQQRFDLLLANLESLTGQTAATREHLVDSFRSRATAETTQVLAGSLSQAVGRQHGYIGTEHVLLSLLSLELPEVANALASAGSSVAELQSEVEEKLPNGQFVAADIAQGGRAYTHLAVDALAAAVEEAVRRDQPMRPLYLLFGIATIPCAMSSRILAARGLSSTALGELLEGLPQ